MYCYILDTMKKDWIESEDLYPSDIALLIDNEHRKIYLYFGAQSKKSDQELGVELAETLRQKYKIYEFETLKDVIPIQIQVQIEMLIGNHMEEMRLKEPRTISMKSFIIASILVNISMLAFIVTQFFLFSSPYYSGFQIISLTNFNQIFSISSIFLWITIGLILFLFVISLLSKQKFLMISALGILVITIGLKLYFDNGLLAFNVEPQDPIEIRRINIVFHLFWVILGFIGICCISTFSIYQIYQKTQVVRKEPIDLETMRKKSKPTILQDSEPVQMKKISE